jgi:iron complex transport system substrate-binding protein
MHSAISMQVPSQKRLKRRIIKAVMLFAALLSTGQAVLAQTKALRIVSVAGSLTEIVYALGAQDYLVAVDTTSLYPAAATQLPKVGYMRQLSAEGVLSMRPSLVLATADAGPPVVIEQLKNAGVRIESAGAEPTFDDLRKRIRAISQLVNKPMQGQQLEEQLVQQMAVARTHVQAQAAKRKGAALRVLFIMASSSSGAASVSGEGTAAHAFIQLAGGVNALSGFKGYRPLTPEAVLSAAPDVILVTQQGLQAIGGAEKLIALPGLSLTPAGKAKRVVALEALYMLGFGPRLPQAVREAADKFVEN